MEIPGRATKLDLADLRSTPIRTFHVTWIAFFLSFLGWFAVAPLMAWVRDDLRLSPRQVAGSAVASVAITVLARLVVGRLCDRVGPRRTYTALLLLGALPVAALGLARDYPTFLLLRLVVGALGASFVITQCHVALLFAPNVVGTASATAAGWGNLGGGVAQFLMPALIAGLGWLGVGPASAWRLALLVPAAALLMAGIAYHRLTRDTPHGDLRELRIAGVLPPPARLGGSRAALEDRAVWLLFLAYAACFGLEITLDNVLALHLHDRFGLSIGRAGAVAACFGAMNLFARTLGGWLSDRCALRSGPRGRARLLAVLLAGEGCALLVFSATRELALAVPALVLLAFFVKASNGATFGLVPFVSARSPGTVAGIVGAGGNMGAVATTLLLWVSALSLERVLGIFALGVLAVAAAAGAWLPARFESSAGRTRHGAESLAPGRSGLTSPGPGSASRARTWSRRRRGSPEAARSTSRST